MVIDRNRGVPVFLQICNHLRRKVLRGEWPQGTRLPNGLDLSREMGVAYQTLVRSLEVLKKEGLLIGIPSQGTFVRATARKLTDVAITFDPQSLKCVSNFDFQRGAASAFGSDDMCLQTFVLPGGRIFSKDSPTTISRLLLDRQIHGVVATSANADDVCRLMELGMPTVTSRAIFPESDAPWVIEDIENAMDQVADLLVNELGHRRVGLVMGAEHGITKKWIRPTGLMAKHLTARLGAQNVAHDIVYSELEWNNAAQVVRSWLASPERPTALFFVSGEMAALGMKMAADLGLSIPKDLSIMAYGPAGDITSVHMPTYELGAAAIELLRKAASGETTSPVQLPTRLMMGATSTFRRQG